jgi:hypothetical protein
MDLNRRQYVSDQICVNIKGFRRKDPQVVRSELRTLKFDLGLVYLLHSTGPPGDPDQTFSWI